jgi:hypothetical protein
MNLLALVLVMICVTGAVFIVANAVQGVPITWLQRQIPLSLASGRLAVSVSPEIPTTKGEPITVTVTDANTLQPVEGASVSISKDGSHLVDQVTDANGHTQFEYPGETTIIVISKAPDYNSEMKVLPKVPDEWIRAIPISVIVAVVADIIVALIMSRFPHSMV